jgi:hypothetical protein
VCPCLLAGASYPYGICRVIKGEEGRERGSLSCLDNRMSCRVWECVMGRRKSSSRMIPFKLARESGPRARRANVEETWRKLSASGPN